MSDSLDTFADEAGSPYEGRLERYQRRAETQRRLIAELRGQRRPAIHLELLLAETQQMIASLQPAARNAL